MDSSSTGPNPGLIHQLALAYRSSAVFFTASDLGVFTHIANGALIDMANDVDEPRPIDERFE